MGGLADAQNRGRMAFAGILGFVPITIILAVVLLNLEGVVSLHKSPLSSPMIFGN